MCRISSAFLSCIALVGLLACGDNNGEGPADGGVDTLPPSVALTYDQLQQACVATGACAVARYTRMKDCIDNFYKVYAENGMQRIYSYMYDCVIKAKGDCRKIAVCMGFNERPQKTGLTCDKSFLSRCDGQKAVTCDLDNYRGGWVQSLDCSLGGLKCGVKDTGAEKVAICGNGSCDTKTYKTNCVQNKSYSCVGGAIQINDCPAQGLQCRDPKIGACEGTGRSWKEMNGQCCKDLNPTTCAGGDVLTRVKNGYLWQVDCTKRPGKKKCDTTFLDCVGSGTECKEDSTFDTCSTDGKTLTACIDGFNTKFDCVALGFADGCESSPSGYGAYCRGKWFTE